MIIEELFTCRSGAALDARFTLAGAEPHYAPDRPFDTEHVRLDLDLDIAKKTLSGTAHTRLRALADGAREMVFDAVGFKVLSVKSGGKALRFDHDKKRLTVHFPAPVPAGKIVEVAVAYRVVDPPLGLHFVGPDKAYPDKPVQVWTQGQDEYARYWFPCHDSPRDRVTSEVLVRVPAGFTAVSNGRLLKKGRARGKDFFHWRQDVPHATYLVTLAVGRFSEIKDKWRAVPVSYYCPPGREDDAKRAFGKTPKMMEFFSQKIGTPYPYPKYAQVAAVDFIYGGMENTSATTQTALTLHDERAHLDFSSDPLVAHELAHQWFGDLLTCREWPHAWLNESFATYFEALFTESDRGADEFRRELAQNAEAYLDEDKDHYRRPIVTRVYKQPSDVFDRHLYEKGSLVLHMLRRLLGEDGFWRSIRTYVADNRGRTVETKDLMDAVEKATGRNMGRFFDQWIFRAGHPEYKVRYWWDAKAKEAKVRVVQTQSVNGETGLFSTPLEFAFHTERGEKRFTETVEKKSHLFSFKLPAEPLAVLFDPEHTILKKVDFPKPQAMWAWQLSHDAHCQGRSEAAQALGRLGGRAAVKALDEALGREKFWGVQGDIALALGDVGSPEAVDALLRAHRHLEHPKARRPLIAALGRVRDDQARLRLKTTRVHEKSYFVEIQALKSLAQSSDPDFPPLFDEYIRQDSWNDVFRCGALEALATYKPADLAAALKKNTAYGRSPALRMTAIRALAQSGGDGAQEHLLSLLDDKHLLVQISAVKALARVGDERVVPALEKLSKGDRDGRLKRGAEEAVQRIKKGFEEEKSAG